ncbi:hypothetical protein TVAG_147080 [Trichomonas vaginalis G3]|uniref:F5/8 type C domain-containing protein n=1 Tax=Trichomonas vaginalis (strain ATCC PRA-98 / G3) TaxID=412133 RepID=A2DL10_TRIV3|nr:hypothetical protein TVAGG3_0362350 [Trichomonas vaginalis G3]EAY18963.1 hypothetical protein TVAG_147080 [Trichomonas vaginalis G3]KAI5532029.1 hypothetical protein TVAGG3_0362350 [Trichomonas vaginalis G3]|eukprot:XP_001579949.1 hypothetical protein [Trichomonas vaginalis G3]
MNFLLILCENILTDSNSILRNAYYKNLVEVSVSGSTSQYINGTKQLTKPEYVFDQVPKNYDWCSNCGKSDKDHPWAVYSVKNQLMNINGYYLKSGCCDTADDACCCYDEQYYCCLCCIYSWSLQISMDNQTWKTIHKVEKDNEMRRCKEKTYKFSETHTAKYVRLIQDESCPGDPPCIAINKIEFIGTTSDGYALDNNVEFDAEDDDVSIIGHISKQSAH